MKHAKQSKERAQRGSDPAEKRTAGRLQLTQVYALTEPLCEAAGIELVHIEYQREAGGRTLRLYIDKPGGVSLDDCAAISRQLGDLLDVYVESEEPYNLEVSSPGAQRPISKAQDFMRFKGRRAKIRLKHAIEGRKNFTGLLAGLVEDVLQLVVDEQTLAIPLEEITKARLVDSNGES